MTHIMSKLNETYLEVEVRLEFYQASREQRLHAHPLLIESLPVFVVLCSLSLPPVATPL